jgi:dihydrofolate reductase
MINLIWAMDKNRLLGSNNRIPWHYKKDLDFFKKMTKDKVVLVGEKTYNSLLYYYKEKLPFSLIYLATLDKNYQNFDKINKVIVINDCNLFLENYKDEIFVIGGKMIYETSFKYASRLYITIIDKEYEGDTYIKEFDLSSFNLISELNDGILTFYEYQKKEIF